GSPERVLNATLRMPDTLFSRVPSDDELTGEIDLRKQNSGKIRVAVSGQGSGPHLAELIWILGQDVVCQRLADVRAHLANQ
ncbi:hypothetical protein EBR57_07970, partial [bacterium]|nr:hypothetical protein [bacterium]